MKRFDARQATRDCVVEIHCGGRLIGSGFFVAEGTVLTCAHVVYGRQDPITVRWRRTVYGVTEARLYPAESGGGGYGLPDAGILRLDALGDHPVVLLADPDELPKAGAVLTALVPQPASLPEFKQGMMIESTATAAQPVAVVEPPAIRQLPVDTILLTAAGASGEGGAWKVVGAGLAPGMSGSPVLDSVTQRVCGMLKSTDGAGRDNWMVAVDLLAAHVPSVVQGNAMVQSAWRVAVSRYAELADRLRFVPVSSSLPAVVSPSTWLMAQHRVVPFHEGLAEFREVCAWVREGEGDVLLVRGPGGVGKTRLALEVCDRFRREGWLTGFVARATQLPDLHLPLRDAMRAGHSVLLVCDYAEGMDAQVNDLLELLGELSGRVRILLLARSAGMWWGRIHGDRRAAEVCVSAIPDDMAVQVLQEAHAAFLGALAVDGPFVPVKLPERRRLLDLHALALAMALDGSTQRDGDPLRRILEHERRYWHRYAVKHQIAFDDVNAPLSDRLLAVPTLLPARDRRQAVAAVAQVPEVPGDGCLRIVTALCGFYPPEGEDTVWDPLQPDRLGEELVADVLLSPDQPEGSLELPLAGADAVQMKRALTVLARVAGLGDSDQEGPGRRSVALGAIRRLLESCPRTAVPALVLVAAEVSTPEPLVELLEPALETDDLDVLFEACCNFPSEHRKLDALASRVTSHYLTLARRCPEPTIDARRALGSALMLRSERSDPIDAAYMMEESVAIYTGLYHEDPSFLDRLVDRLGRYAQALSRADQHELAREQAKRAIDLVRAAALADPETYGEDYGWLLRVHASVLIVKERFADAEELARQATEWYLSLSLDDHRWAIAMARGQLAQVLAGLGRGAEAADLQRLVVDVYELEADGEALCWEIGKLGWYELMAGLVEAAQAAADRCFELCHGVGSDLLEYVAALLAELGASARAEELRARASSAAQSPGSARPYGVRPLSRAAEVDLFASLASEDAALYRLDLVRAQRAVARELLASGDAALALRTVEEAVALLPPQRDASPQDAVLEWNLMASLWSDALTAAGRAAEVPAARQRCTRAVANLEEQQRIERAAYREELRRLVE